MNTENLHKLKDILETDDLASFEVLMEEEYNTTGLTIEDVDSKYLNKKQNSMLNFAAKKFSFNITKYLLENTKLPIDFLDASGYTPFFLWVHSKNAKATSNPKISLDIIKTFIDKGASLYKENNNKDFPLMEIFNNNVLGDEIVDYLIKEKTVFWGIEINESPLPILALMEDKKYFKNMFEVLPDTIKAKLLYKTEEPKKNLLYVACADSNISLDNFCYLLDNSNEDKIKNINFYDKNDLCQKTLLMACIKYGDCSNDEDKAKIKEIFSRKIVNVNLINEKGETALMLALKKENFKIAELLLENGADLFSQTMAGQDAIDKFVKELQYENKKLHASVIQFVKPNKEKILLNNRMNKTKRISIGENPKKAGRKKPLL